MTIATQDVLDTPAHLGLGPSFASAVEPELFSKVTLLEEKQPSFPGFVLIPPLDFGLILPSDLETKIMEIAPG